MRANLLMQNNVVNIIRYFVNTVFSFSLLTIAFLFSTPLQGFAQAWVAPSHSGTLSLDFQWIDNTGHRVNDGNLDLKYPGKSDTSAIYIDIDYAFTDRFSAEIGLPYVFAKYIGPGPTPGPFLPVDNCFCWHSGLQDFGMIVRYNLIGEIGGSFQLTPSVSVGTPSRNYAFQGEAVVGANLDEVAAAIDVGTRLDAISPRLAIEARYSYAFVEQVLDISHNRSNIRTEVAFRLTRTTALRGLASWQITHGGLRIPEDIMRNPELFVPQHDRLLRDDYFRAGMGISYELPHLEMYATYIAYVSGTNTHAGRAFSTGVSWPFNL